MFSNLLSIQVSNVKLRSQTIFSLWFIKLKRNKSGLAFGIIPLCLLLTISNYGCTKNPVADTSASIVGRVYNESGDVVANATLSLTTSSKTTTSDSVGAFIFRGLNAGSYTIVAVSSVYGSGTASTVIEPNGISICDVHVKAPRDSSIGTIVGWVKNADGTAAAHATVSTVPSTSALQTDSLGEFIISNAQVGLYTVNAVSTLGLKGSQTVVVHASQVSLCNISLEASSNASGALQFDGLDNGTGACIVVPNRSDLNLSGHSFTQ